MATLIQEGGQCQVPAWARIQSFKFVSSLVQGADTAGKLPVTLTCKVTPCGDDLPMTLVRLGGVQYLGKEIDRGHGRDTE